MVFLTRLTFSGKNQRRFVDKLRIHVCGGKGGQGLAKYGGIGGRGGNIYLVGDDNTRLKDIKIRNPSQNFKAAPGNNSSPHSLQGGPGEDLLINCPPGISVVMDSNVVLAEVNKAGEKILIAKGGKGGSPLNNFSGELGHQHNINLDLKLIADIGLVGFPNAGKSTLLKSLSRATPKIATYPFTTIEPRIAMLEYPDLRQITMADLPGLIEGAHMNVGMGHKFLKHVERTKMLLFIVDVFGFRLNPRYPLRSSFENVLLLNRELELYKEELVNKPAILVINKIDIPGSDAKLKEIMGSLENMKESIEKVDESLRPTNLMKFDDILTISAKKKENTDSLKLRLRELLDYHQEKQSEQEELEKHKNQAEYFKLTGTEHIGVKFV